MRKLKLVLLLGLLAFVGCGSLSFAQSAPDASLSLSNLLSKLQVNSGVGWDFKNKQVVNTETIKVLEYAPIEAPKNRFLALIDKDNLDPSVDVGYTTTDKFVIGLSFDALKLSKYGVQIPIVDLIDVRPFVEYSFYHLTSADAGNIKNSWIAGITIINVHF